MQIFRAPVWHKFVCLAVFVDSSDQTFGTCSLRRISAISFVAYLRYAHYVQIKAGHPTRVCHDVNVAVNNTLALEQLWVSIVDISANASVMENEFD
jgi:hypothetical protein